LAEITVLSRKIQCYWLNNWISHWRKLLSFHWTPLMQDTLVISSACYEYNLFGCMLSKPIILFLYSEKM